MRRPRPLAAAPCARAIALGGKTLGGKTGGVMCAWLALARLDRSPAGASLHLQSGRHRAAGQLQIQQPLDFANLAALTLRAERGGGSAKPGASGTAHAMNEILGHLRQIVIDHVRDAFDVHSAGGDIGGHQDAIAAFLESAQRHIALGLACGRRESRRLCDPLRTSFFARRSAPCLVRANTRKEPRSS